MSILNSDEAMKAHPRFDTIGQVMIAVGSILTSIGTRIVKARNELLTEALHEQEDRIGAAYQAGRQDERDGLPNPGLIEDTNEDQGNEHQGDETCWCGEWVSKHPLETAGAHGEQAARLGAVGEHERP